MSGNWTTPADIRARLRKRWDNGSLLTALARDDAFPEFDLPVKGPKAGEVGDDLAKVRRWIDTLAKGSHGGQSYAVDYATVGGRLVGRNQLPARVRVMTFEQAWRLLGVAAEVAAFQRILQLTTPFPVVREWVAQHPLSALAVAEDWPGLLAAYSWLYGARGSGRYLREITAQGVDTKFVEHHRSVLAQLLAVDRSATGFVTGLGLRGKPELLRLRCDPGVLRLPAPLTEITARVDELAQLTAAPDLAIIVENEVTFLSMPVPHRGIVLWGKGFEVDRAGSMPWLRDVPVDYWGDLDTHGFAILDRLRAWLPQTESFLMDRETLLAHQDRWVVEHSPTAASLHRLRPAERQLYDALVTDQFAVRVRLEQERVDWAWARDRFPASTAPYRQGTA